MEPEDYLLKFPLGKEIFQISTTDERCQKWFNIALALCYGFNHEECQTCCQRAISYDPLAPMPYFLISFSLGVNYNANPPSFTPQQMQQQFSFWQKANKIIKENDKATDIEQQLVSALQHRVGDGKTLEHTELDQNFAKAMKLVYFQYPENPTIACLYAQSMMDLRPWNLWVQQDSQENQYGEPYELTQEIGKVLENGLQLNQEHLGLRHLWIHYWELSQSPQKAGDIHFKRKIRDISPGLGHLCHMPSHIDILTGDYQQAIQNNQKGIQADDIYFKYRDQNKLSQSCFYIMYRLHNLHFLVYAACFSGNYAIAYDTCLKIIDILQPEILKDTVNFSPSGAFLLEGFLAVILHVYIRFGQWKEILEQPFSPYLKIEDLKKEPEIYSSTLATLSYAKAIALAVLAGLQQQTEDQEEQIKLSLEAKAEFVTQLSNLDDRVIFNVPLKQSLEVGVVLMEGEILYRMEKYQEAFKFLRLSVELSDKLPYDEPWGWMIPARHALGALLSQEGIRTDNLNLVLEAEKAYQEDFGLVNGIQRSVWHPNNIWSLMGLQRIYQYLKNDSELSQINEALVPLIQNSDVQMTSSCMCSVKL